MLLAFLRECVDFAIQTLDLKAAKHCETRRDASRTLAEFNEERACVTDDNVASKMKEE